MPLLTANYEVLALDLPGHGFSARLPDNSMSLPAMSEAIAELLRRVEFQPRCVVGHSAGAAIALRMALDGAINPDSIIGLNAALLPFGGGLQRILAPMAQLFANTQLMPMLIAKRANDIRAVRRILKGTGSNLDDTGVDFYQRLLQREEHVAAVLSMMASWNLQPLLDDLPQLVPRLHLVAGGRDKAVSPREAEKIAAALPGTTVTCLDGCGHLAHEEQAARVADVIGEFCRQEGRC
jgi:magnesium chelatase accessory protein